MPSSDFPIPKREEGIAPGIQTARGPLSYGANMMKFEHEPVEIEVRNLRKSFGSHLVLDGINLTVKRGEMIAIVGGSGCGKTVLLQHLIGHLHPDAGDVWLADHLAPGSPLVQLGGLDDEHMDHLRKRWAVVFQRNALTSGTVEENICLPLLWAQGVTQWEARRRAVKSCQAVGLDPKQVLRLRRDDLSGGMAKRVAIARALALDPLLIFFDEPTAGLDPDHAKLIEKLILKTHERVHDGLPCTTVIITHDKELLYRLQPRIVMLHDGKVYFDGSYTEFSTSNSVIVRPYFELMPALHDRSIPLAG